jgi:choline dehydrogenase-like flavoprotein
MILDMHDMPHGTHLQTDLCIVGGGIAGLILADALKESSLDVLVLEGGGIRDEDASQALMKAEMAGWPHRGSSEGRFRVLGGSSTRWGGQLLPLLPHDFAARDHVPDSGWPIDASTLAPYLLQIEKLMGVNHRPYDDRFCAGLKPPVPNLETNGLQLRFSKWAPFSRRNLGRTLGSIVAEHPRVRLMVHANVTRIGLRQNGGGIDGVVARDLEGKRCTVQARLVVLCCGTIETVRLLLASEAGPRRGIGNHTGLLGRYFHDHLSVAIATLTGEERNFCLQGFAPWFRGSTRHSPKLESSRCWQEGNGCLNTMGHFVFESPEGSAIAWARARLQRHQGGSEEVKDPIPWSALVRDGRDLIQMAYRSSVNRRRWIPRRAAMVLCVDSEQAPNPASRIELSHQCNALGEPLAKVDWRWGSREVDSIKSFTGLLNQQWQRWGLGGLALRTDWEQQIHDTIHPMGGTRMSRLPGDGVVNEHLQVHGIPNLYVASCSVFPTGGSSNPTLTLMTLCLRLADHLRRAHP